MNNLKKFSTEAEYNAATLNYPAVSWVTGTDTVHFDKESSVNNKVKIAFTTDACCQGKTMIIGDYTMYDSINGITVNGEPLTPSSSYVYLPLSNNTDYLIEYELKDGVSNVSNWFEIEPVEGCTSTRIKYDILFPAQVTSIGGLYNNGFNNLILEPTTPPSISYISSDLSGGIYVPDSAVNTYKNAEVWDVASYYIDSISQYSGKIPV